MYNYKAKVLSIYDGDTMTLEIDLGFKISHIIKIRLAGIDTPEIRTKNKKEKELAYKVRDYLRNMLLNKEVIITTEKSGKYGRYLCHLYYDDTYINNHLIVLGYAKPYDGGKREPFFP